MNCESIIQVITIVVTLFIGIIALFKEDFYQLRKKPKLNLSIQLSPPDCHKTFLTHLETGQYVQDAYYFRLRIENIGNVSAQNVEVFIASLKKKCIDGTYEIYSKFLPMNNTWSHIGGIYFPSISPNMHKHCDLGYIAQYQVSNEFVFQVEQIVKPNTGGHLLEKGTYQAEIIVSANNATPVKFRMELKFNGQWFEKEVDMFKDGIGIYIEKLT